MKTWVKWLLGVLLGLAAVAALTVIGLFVFNLWDGIGWAYGGRAFRIWEGGRVMPWYWMPMHPTWGFPFGRFGAFFPWGPIFGGVIWLGLLVLIVLGALALVCGLSRPTQAAGTKTVMTTPSPACPNCGRPVQVDWRLCPYCGQVLTEKRDDETSAVV